MSLKPIRSSEASSPLNFKIRQLTNTFDPTNFSVKIRIPHLKDSYKDISKIQQIMVVAHQIVFKIQQIGNKKQKQSNLRQSSILKQSKRSQMSSSKLISNNVIYLTGQLIVSQQKEQIFCQVSNQEGKIQIKGKILNKNHGDGLVFDLSVSNINNYADFYKFRKKYKTLENITRKLNFNLDHRLKIVQNNLNKQNYYFSLEEDDNQHYFFSVDQELSIVIQQIYSVEDWYDIQQIFEQKISLKSLIDKSSTKQFSHKLQLQFQKLNLIIKADIIQNQNLSGCELISLRVLQTSNQQKSILIGTDKMKRTRQLPSLIDGKYYDYEYGYLCKNLKDIQLDENQQSQSVFQNLSKLTKCFPKYPHFINQNIIDVKNCLTVEIETDSGCQYSIPFVYILNGYNIFHTQKNWIKFYIEFQSQSQKKQSQKKMKQRQKPKAGYADKRRIYQMKINDIWNLSNIIQQKFEIKIICHNIIYSIPFQTSLVQVNAFKKQSRNLQNKVQYNERLNQRFYLLKWQNSQKVQKRLSMVKTESLKQFYLLDLYSIGSVSFQISSENKVLMTGFLSKNDILETKGQTKIIISSANQSQKVVLLCSFQEIQFQNNSLRSVYNFRYQLYYADNSMFPADVTYDLEIKRTNDNKKFRKRIIPQQKTQDYNAMKDFYQQGLFTKYLQQQVSISLRKMYYDDLTNIFDNQELVHKKIVINPQPEKLLQKDCTFIRVQKQSYDSLEIDFYDNNIKQRLKLLIQVSLKKFQFLDQENARYVIRVPQLFWKYNSIKQKQSLCFQSLLSHKKKRGDKVQISYGDIQQFKLPRHNYKDAFSIKVNEKIGFARVVDAVRLKCDVLKDSIGWIKQSEWYLGIINIQNQMFYFLVKTEFDPHADQDGKDNGSDKSARTVSRGKSPKDNIQKGKANPFAKTMRSMDIFKLKMMKNDLITQSRHLTLKVVQRQEKIAQLNKKIIQIDDNLRKKQQKQHLIRQQNKNRKVSTKQNARLKKLYRQICECGAKNPEYNGFCGQCLTNMKKRYETILKDYKQKSLEYQKIAFQKKNKRLKLIKAKQKLKNYYDKLNAGQDIDDSNLIDLTQQLQQKQLKRRIEQLKIDLFTIEEQKKTISQMSKLQQLKMDEKMGLQGKQIENALQQLKQLKIQMQHIKERARLDAQLLKKNQK